jgi:ribosomal protein S24E
MSSQETEYQISIIEDRVNPLMERREMKFEIAAKATPKRDLIRKAVATSLKVPMEKVYVMNTLSTFGTSTSICKVHIYEDAARGKSIEPSYIQLRNLSREERKQSISAAATAKAEAAKKEEKKPAAGQKVK